LQVKLNTATKEGHLNASFILLHQSLRRFYPPERKKKIWDFLKINNPGKYTFKANKFARPVGIANLIFVYTK
jgi:hypothetical protein